MTVVKRRVKLADWLFAPRCAPHLDSPSELACSEWIVGNPSLTGLWKGCPSSDHNCGLDPADWRAREYQMIPCDVHKTTVGLDVSVKDARLPLAVPFDLHEQPTVDKLGKTREER